MFTKEQMEKAKENKVELTGDDAKQFFAENHRNNELADNEVDQVAGGEGVPPKPTPII